jgi:integrase/recombinase XerD
VSELTALKVSDFTGTALVVRKGKGDKRRSILLAHQTQKLFRQLVRAKKEVLHEPVGPEDHFFLSERRRPYTTRGVRKRVKLWFSRCGLNKNLSCHTARHSYLSHLLGSGVDPITARDNAGHGNLATTSLYAHVTKRDLGDLELYSSGSDGSENYSRKKKHKD